MRRTVVRNREGECQCYKYFPLLPSPLVLNGPPAPALQVVDRVSPLSGFVVGPSKAPGQTALTGRICKYLLPRTQYIAY